jgi:RNA polymerase sigma-70 factor (ECF subfamily)
MLVSEGITPVPGPAASNVTRVTLLSRVRDPSDSAAWAEFESRYRDLLVRFCRRQGLQQADAEDLVQVVMANLSKSLPRFAYDPARGRFRDYLYRCARNAISQWSSRPRGREIALDTGVETALAIDAPRDAASVRAWEEEWVAHHYRLAMRTIRNTFEARSVEIFDRSIAGETVATLAAAYDMSEQAVHKVRQRIKARMEELIAVQVAEEDEPGAG